MMLNVVNHVEDLFSNLPPPFTAKEAFRIIPSSMNSKGQPYLDAYITEPHSKTEAEALVAIYTEVYKGTYPYPEMLDVDHVYRLFDDRRYVIGLLRISTTNDVAGCFMSVIDWDQKRAYLRSLMIRPLYQGKVNVRELCLAVVRYTYALTEGQILVWYGEARTAHTSSQYIATCYGARPCAIFLNKDIFFGQRESDVLMIAHTQAAMNLHRIPHVTVIADAVPFATLINTTYKIPPQIQIASDSIQQYIRVPTVIHLLQNLHVECHPTEYVYSHLQIALPGTNACLEGLYTATVHNIEKIHYTYTTFEEFAALVVGLRAYLERHAIAYCELFTTTQHAAEQAIARWAGFHVFGYAPAWHYLPQSNQLEDQVIFGYSQTRETPAIQLIPLAERLLALLQFSLQSSLPLRAKQYEAPSR